MDGKVDDENVFYPSLFSRARLYDFVFSVDIAIASSVSGSSKTSCGIMMNGQNENYSGTELIDVDMLAFYFTRLGKYRLDSRQSAQWASSAILTDTSGAILQSVPSNRLTAIMVDKKLTVFINGVQIFSSAQDYTGGMIGYFMIKGVKGSDEHCTFSNMRVWRLN